MKKISNWFKFNEKIDFGKAKPFSLKNELYKSDEYICSSFEYLDNENETMTVVVSGIIIDEKDIIQKTPSRHYITLNNYLLQFGIQPDKFLHVGFSEYKNGVYNDDKNSNNQEVLFRKMSTIIEIIKDLVTHFNCDKVIYVPTENDMESGLNKPYNKRDSFYNLFLNYYNIPYRYIKDEYTIDDMVIKNFFILNV